LCVILLEYLFLYSDNLEPMSVESLKVGGRQAPKSLRPCAADAYLLFQVSGIKVMLCGCYKVL